MKTLTESLLSGPHKDAVIADFVRLVEDQVANTGGLKGIGLRAGLKMLQAAKPGILDRATSKLLPDFLEALEPLHQKFRTSKEASFSAFLQKNAKPAAAALIAAADRRAAAASPGTKSYYDKFRKGADADVQKMVSALGTLIGKHLKA